MEKSKTPAGLAFIDDLNRLYSIGYDDDFIEPVKLFEPEKDIQFDLFTMDNPKEPQKIAFGNWRSLAQSNFNKNNPTRIFIHGWLPSGCFTTELPDAYFEKGNHTVNYIAINWEEGAKTYLYNTARNRVGAVAEYTAKFIDFLAKIGGMQFKDLIVIGFSLGAHVGGIGNNVYIKTIPEYEKYMILLLILAPCSRKKGHTR